MSVVSNRDRDCILCRLVSGGGLIGAGAYVGYHSNAQSKSFAKIGMRGFAAALILLGSARILGLGPFKPTELSHPL